ASLRVVSTGPVAPGGRRTNPTPRQLEPPRPPRGTCTPRTRRGPARRPRGRRSRRSCPEASSAPVRPSWVMMRGMVYRYFYDCEFIEDGRTIDLVSIGVVDEYGREFYALSTEFDDRTAVPWVRRNVLHRLPRPSD